jgi:hypothetical protein
MGLPLQDRRRHGMFGHHEKRTGGEGERMQVDAALESDLAEVEQSVADYLKDPNGATRQPLLAALERLDDQTGRSDAYEGSVIGSGAVGYSSKGQVFGETGIDSVVDEIPSSELQAQVALVTAAKDEVRRSTTHTLAALRSASDALAATRDQGAAGR